MINAAENILYLTFTMHDFRSPKRCARVVFIAQKCAILFFIFYEVPAGNAGKSNGCVVRWRLVAAVTNMKLRHEQLPRALLHWK